MQHAVASAVLGVACLLCCSKSLAQAGDQAEPSAEPPVPAARAPAQATRIVLVASPGMEELVARFIAELSSLRLEVVRAPDAEVEPSAAELERLATEQGARAAVRVTKAGTAIDLWLVNPHSHEVVYRRVAGGDQAVLVLRSLEILRGALVDLKALEHEPRPAPEPAARTAPEDRAPAPATARAARPLWLGLAGALVLPRFGHDLIGGAQVSLQRGVGSRFALHGELLVPLGEWSVSGVGGRAEVWASTANLAMLVVPWGERTFTPALGLGLGVVALHTRGEPAAGYRGTSDLNAAAFPHGRVELALRLTPAVRLRASLVAGFATPRPVLLFTDQRQESWLNPLLLYSLSVELGLP